MYVTERKLEMKDFYYRDINVEFRQDSGEVISSERYGYHLSQHRVWIKAEDGCVGNITFNPYHNDIALLSGQKVTLISAKREGYDDQAVIFINHNTGNVWKLISFIKLRENLKLDTFKTIQRKFLGVAAIAGAFAYFAPFELAWLVAGIFAVFRFVVMGKAIVFHGRKLQGFINKLFQQEVANIELKRLEAVNSKAVNC